MNRVSRRQIAAMLAALALHSDRPVFASAKSSAPEVLQLSRNGPMPNNERLPVLLYHGAFDVVESDSASVFEQAFERNGWPSRWRNGVYDFHHYHSTAHEVLGFARGHARLILGGEAAAKSRCRPVTCRVANRDRALQPREQRGFSGGWRLSARSALGHLPERADACRSGTNAATCLSRLRPR
jgi:hypothetical protein